MDRKLKEIQEKENISRRGSLESGVTTTSSSSKTSSSSSGSSSSSDSSTDSDSDSSTDDDGNKKDQTLKQFEIDALYKICIKNLEECVTRFPEHYKSIYRLVYHFSNATGETKSLDNCKQLLLSTYKTTLGSHITGLFTERKNNNFFNVSINIIFVRKNANYLKITLFVCIFRVFGEFLLLKLTVLEIFHHILANV